MICGSPIEADNVPLSHLDDYSLLDIFDNLSFYDLINLAGSDARFRQLITEHYMIPKYYINERKIRFDGGGAYDEATNTTIIIGKFSTILRFLTDFGDVITRIYFSGFSYSPSERDQISRHISKYCSKSLISIDLEQAGGFLINGTTAKFTSLTEAKLRNDCHSYGNPQIHRIFPVLKELSLMFTTTMMDEVTLTYLHDLLALLPDLRLFELNKTPSEQFLRSIEDISPNLQSLAFGYIPNDAELEHIHFRNIRKLTLNILFFSLNEPIASCPFTFDHLQALEIITTKIAFIPVNLLAENLELKSLALPKLQNMEGLFELLTSIKDANHFDTFTVLWSRWMGSDCIMRLLNEYDQLKNITFIVWDGFEHSLNFDALLSLIPKSWDLTVVSKDSTDALIRRDVALKRI